MLRLEFAVEDADGRRNITVGPATLVAWERKTGRKMSSFAEGFAAEDMAWLVWHADKRAGNTKKAFDDYLEDVLDFGEADLPKAPSDEGPSDS
jgi:hypothetical protein